MTRRSSVRAQAQEFYDQMAEDDRARGPLTKSAPAADSDPDTPTPNPSPQGGGEQVVLGGRERAAASGEGQTTDLTARARALYEGSAVPVREIARLAGVSERTLYKYVEKGGWKRRYRVAAQDEAAARANRGRRVRPAAGFAPVKGAGGRFVRREDAGKPFAVGLKALDPAAHARADAACANVARLARRAEADAEAERWGVENCRAIRAVVQAQQDLDAYDAARGKEPARSSEDRLRERALPMSLDVALAWMKMTIGAWERAVLASLAPAP